MEGLYNEVDMLYKILCENKSVTLDDNMQTLKNKYLVSPVTGVITKIDSNNTEIIIRTYDGDDIFLYLNKYFEKELIISFVKEQDLIFKGAVILEIDCGYENTDLTILKLKN